MSSHHVIIWLDHVEAHIIHFTVDMSQEEIVKSHSKHLHLHVKAGNLGSGRTPENAGYFEDIVNAINDSTEILLMGPGSEKDEFMKYVAKHHKPVADNIVAALKDDHPTDPQLLAFARKYFVKLDRLNVDPVEALRHA
jgi:stalled ribosome rescue protein Dom34